jgi:DNA-binding MarR family transcriptional regulator
MNAGQLFGGRLRTQTLYAISALNDTYATEIADAIGTHRPNVSRLLDDLEADGLIVRRGTRVRRVSLNPQFVAARELAALLERLVDNDPEFVDRLGELRRRPRRPGKSLQSQP